MSILFNDATLTIMKEFLICFQQLCGVKVLIKFCSSLVNLPNVNVQNFLKFNDPKSRKPKVRNIVTRVLDFRSRQYMMSPKIAGFRSLVNELHEKVQSYLDYLSDQREGNQKVRSSQGSSKLR